MMSWWLEEESVCVCAHSINWGNGAGHCMWPSMLHLGCWSWHSPGCEDLKLLQCCWVGSQSVGKHLVWFPAAHKEQGLVFRLFMLHSLLSCIYHPGSSQITPQACAPGKEASKWGCTFQARPGSSWVSHASPRACQSSDLSLLLLLSTSMLCKRQ